MQWLIIFVQSLLRMWTDDGARPGLVRRYAPAYARNAPRVDQYTGQPRFDRIAYQAGNEWFPPARARQRCAPPAPEGPPGG